MAPLVPVRGPTCSDTRVAEHTQAGPWPLQRVLPGHPHPSHREPWELAGFKTGARSDGMSIIIVAYGTFKK